MDISYSEIRQNLKKMIDLTTSTHEPMFINSHKKRTAVLLSYEDYSALEETVYLLKSRENAKRLLQAVSDLSKNMNISSHNLVDDEA